MCDAKQSWPLYIFVLEASYRQEKKNYIQTKFITMNGLFLRISTARIRHPDQQARIFIFKPCIEAFPTPTTTVYKGAEILLCYAVKHYFKGLALAALH